MPLPSNSPRFPSRAVACRGRWRPRPAQGLAALALSALLVLAGCAKTGDVEALQQTAAVQQKQLRDLQETTTEAFQRMQQEQQARIEALESELQALKAEYERSNRVLQARTGGLDTRTKQLQEGMTGLSGVQEQTQTQVARAVRRVEDQNKLIADFQATERDERHKLQLQLDEIQKLLTTPVAGLPDKTVADKDWRQAFFALVSGQLDLSAERFEAFEKAHAKDERVPEAIYRKGQSWFLQRRYDLAVVPFFNLLDAYPQHALAVEAKWRLARCLEETGELRSARDFYEELIRQQTPYAQDATRRVAFINRILPAR